MVEINQENLQTESIMEVKDGSNQSDENQNLNNSKKHDFHEKKTSIETVF